MYLFYLGLFVVLLIIEAMTVNFVSIWISIASLVTCVFAFFFPEMYTAQIMICIVLSIILILLTKPFTEKVKAKKTSTNSDMLIGETAIVTEDIDNIESAGYVKIRGQIWTARTADGKKIEKNKKVTVEKIEGVKLIVTENKEELLCHR